MENAWEISVNNIAEIPCSSVQNFALILFLGVKKVLFKQNSLKTLFKWNMEVIQ